LKDILDTSKTGASRRQTRRRAKAHRGAARPRQTDSESRRNGKNPGEHKGLRALTVPQHGDDAVAGTFVFSMTESAERVPRLTLSNSLERSRRAAIQMRSARCQFAAGVLRLDALFRRAEFGAGAPVFEGVQNIFICVCRPWIYLGYYCLTISKGSNTAFSRRETPPAIWQRRPAGDICGVETTDDDIANAEPQHATGGVRTLLRLEGLTLFLGMTLLYGLGRIVWVYAACSWRRSELCRLSGGPRPARHLQRCPQLHGTDAR